MSFLTIREVAVPYCPKTQTGLNSLAMNLGSLYTGEPEESKPHHVNPNPDIRWKQRFQNFDRAFVLLRDEMENGPSALNPLEKEAKDLFH